MNIWEKSRLWPPSAHRGQLLVFLVEHISKYRPSPNTYPSSFFSFLLPCSLPPFPLLASRLATTRRTVDINSHASLSHLFDCSISCIGCHRSIEDWDKYRHGELPTSFCPGWWQISYFPFFWIPGEWQRSRSRHVGVPNAGGPCHYLLSLHYRNSELYCHRDRIDRPKDKVEVSTWIFLSNVATIAIVVDMRRIKMSMVELKRKPMRISVVLGVLVVVFVCLQYLHLVWYQRGTQTLLRLAHNGFSPVCWYGMHPFPAAIRDLDL